MGRRVVYVSRLMKGWEVREACKQFREQEAPIRRQQFVVLPRKEAPEFAGEQVGCF